MAEVEYKYDETAGKKIKVACQHCGADKNHVVLRSVEESGSEEMGPSMDFYWHTSFQLIQCQGCDAVSFRSLSSNSEDVDPRGDTVESEELYPSRTKGRTLLEDFHVLPTDLERIYRETVAALNGSQPVLAGIGIRAIIETVTKEKNATGKDLFEKINGLVGAGVLTKDGADILHKLRVLGNKSAHEVKAHSATELNLAMDVVEHLLQAVYILPFHAKRTFK